MQAPTTLTPYGFFKMVPPLPMDFSDPFLWLNSQSSVLFLKIHQSMLEVSAHFNSKPLRL